MLLINCFEVPAGREDDFLRRWQSVNSYLVAKPGYRAHRLHKSVAPDARYRFINVAEWESAADFARAHDDGFRQLVSGPGWSDYRSTPALYEVVHAGAPASDPVEQVVH